MESEYIVKIQRNLSITIAWATGYKFRGGKSKYMHTFQMNKNRLEIIS